MVPEHPTKIVYFQACKLPMVLVEKLIVLDNYFMAWTKVFMCRSDEVNNEGWYLPISNFFQVGYFCQVVEEKFFFSLLSFY